MDGVRRAGVDGGEGGRVGGGDGDDAGGAVGRGDDGAEGSRGRAGGRLVGFLYVYKQPMCQLGKSMEKITTYMSRHDHFRHRNRDVRLIYSRYYCVPSVNLRIAE